MDVSLLTPAALLLVLLAAVPLGGWLLLRRRKGDWTHLLLGRVWAGLMAVTALASFWLTGLTGGIGPLHLLSVLTLWSLVRAIRAVRRGDLRGHRRALTGCYVGLLLAGAFVFVPTRLLGSLVFG